MDKQKVKAKTLRLTSVISNIIDSNSMVAGRKVLGMAANRKSGKKGGAATAKVKKSGKEKKSSAPPSAEEQSITIEDDTASAVMESQRSSPTHSHEVSHSAGEEEAEIEAGSSEDEEEGDSDSTLESSQQPPKKKRKKAKPFVTLSEEEQARIMLWIEENELLYNKKLNDNKDTKKKRATWQDQADQLNFAAQGKGRPDVTGYELSRWWRNIRTRFKKSLNQTQLREASTSAATIKALKLTDREQWIYERCLFLTPHVRTNKIKTKFTKKELQIQAVREAAEAVLRVDTAQVKNYKLPLSDVQAAGLSTETLQRDPLLRPLTPTGGSRPPSRGPDSTSASQQHLTAQSGRVEAMQRSVESALSQVNDPPNEWVALGNMVATTGVKMEGNLGVDFYEAISQLCTSFRRQHATRNLQQQLPPTQQPPPPPPPQGFETMQSQENVILQHQQQQHLQPQTLYIHNQGGQYSQQTPLQTRNLHLMQTASPAMSYGQSGQSMSLAEAQIRRLVSQSTSQTLDNSFTQDFAMPPVTTPNFTHNLASMLHPPPASSTKEDDRNASQ